MTMETNHNPSGSVSDLEYAIRLIMSGKNDPEFAARVQAETETITEEIRRTRGALDIAVDLIRAGRDDE
jgi:hypothetical protein